MDRSSVTDQVQDRMAKTPPRPQATSPHSYMIPMKSTYPLGTAERKTDDGNEWGQCWTLCRRKTTNRLKLGAKSTTRTGLWSTEIVDHSVMGILIFRVPDALHRQSARNSYKTSKSDQSKYSSISSHSSDYLSNHKQKNLGY